MRKRKMMTERETGRGEMREDWVGGVCVCRETDAERDGERWKVGRSNIGGGYSGGRLKKKGQAWKLLETKCLGVPVWM